MDTTTPCISCSYFKAKHCSHPQENTFPTEQEINLLNSLGKEIPRCPGFAAKTTPDYRCQYLEGLTVLPSRPHPSLTELLWRVGFTTPCAASLATWLTNTAIPQLLSDSPPPPGTRAIFLTQDQDLGSRFLKWLSPPGHNPWRQPWIGVWEKGMGPTIEVEIRESSTGDTGIPEFILPASWNPGVSTDTIWAYALFWHRESLLMARGNPHKQ